MFDLPGRLLIAYGLIGIVILAGAAYAFWRSRNTQAVRDGKARARLEERYRVRDEARSEGQSAEG